MKIEQVLRGLDCAGEDLTLVGGRRWRYGNTCWWTSTPAGVLPTSPSHAWLCSIRHAFQCGAIGQAINMEIPIYGKFRNSLMVDFFMVNRSAPM